MSDLVCAYAYSDQHTRTWVQLAGQKRDYITTITNGLGLLNLPAGINLLVTGGVLILAATVDALSRLRSGGARV